MEKFYTISRLLEPGVDYSWVNYLWTYPSTRVSKGKAPRYFFQL